jgi:hypothetical protein
VLAALAARFEPERYRRTEQTFWKELGDCRLVFHVSVIRHSEDVELMTDVAVRHHAVEDLLNNERPGLRPREKKQTATVGVELGNWVNGQPHRWIVSTLSEVDAVAADIFDWFRRIGKPFLERFQSLDEVFRVLEADGSEAELTCPIKDRRRKTTLVVQRVREQSNKALARLAAVGARHGLKVIA